MKVDSGQELNKYHRITVWNANATTKAYEMQQEAETIWLYNGWTEVIPFSKRPQLDAMLDELESAKVIEKVDYADPNA